MEFAFSLACLVRALDAFGMSSTMSRQARRHSRLFMITGEIPPPHFVKTSSVITALPQSNILPMRHEVYSQWIQGRDQVNPVVDSSSLTVSIQEYKKPTKEEVAAKKRNFNVLFWGGGFAAPFIATVFYFGFRFWEK